MKINPLTAIDFYKADHRRQYPEGTTEVYSNLTARSSKHFNTANGTDLDKVVFVGLQYFIQDFLIDTWNEGFFKLSKDEVINQYKKRMDNALGPDAIDVEHIKALHDLGYLPIEIRALPEGTRVPIGVPMLTIKNTKPEFFWLTNYLESVMSSYLWKPITSATSAFEYKKLLLKYATETDTPTEFIQFQAHDFSFRGLSGVVDAASSGFGHLTSFWGTDTVLAIDFAEQYYGAQVDKAMVGCSVPATEHSVMCLGTKVNERQTFERLITDLYPTGIVSIVSDTWDFWKVITEFMPQLRTRIMSREGKVVIRPDSGDPVKIIIGDSEAEKGTPEYKGAIECLWEVFGGTVTKTGHKMLDDHVGLIYGDAITLQRAKDILEGLKKKGFASGNVVFGVGSYTYQYVTRDTFGFAIKSTSGVVNGERREIFKDPKTDSGVKKSAKGLLNVYMGMYGDLRLADRQKKLDGLLVPVFRDGEFVDIPTTLEAIRARLEEEL